MLVPMIVAAFIAAAGISVERIVPGADLGPPLDEACQHFHDKGWYNMSTNDQIGYVVLCKPRGWA